MVRAHEAQQSVQAGVLMQNARRASVTQLGGKQPFKLRSWTSSWNDNSLIGQIQPTDRATLPKRMMLW